MLLLVAGAANSAYAESTLTEQLLRCANFDNDQMRLDCYDQLVRNRVSQVKPTKPYARIQPPADFLDSRLVAVPWIAEYDLSVREFVKLISHAVLDDGKHISVQGWSRDKQDYVFNITMRTPVTLHFLPRASEMKSPPMSLLREVTMDGNTISAGQFILIIAAMESGG